MVYNKGNLIGSPYSLVHFKEDDMKINNLSQLLLTLSCISLMFTVLAKENQETEEDGLFTIDSIQAIVFGDEELVERKKIGDTILTLSDVYRPSLDGTSHSLQDLVIQDLIYRDAARFHMTPNPEAIDDHLKSVQREHNLSLDDLKSIFANGGYTYEEGREQFGTMTAIGTMLDFRIRSRLIVPEKEILAYYEEHPIMQEASFQVKKGLVECPSDWQEDKFNEELEKLIQGKQSQIEVCWCEPFWDNASELAEDKAFFKTMEVGSIAIGSVSASGTELFKLINKKDEHLVTLEDRYNEIADILKRPKYQELFMNYKDSLMRNSGVVYYQQSGQAKAKTQESSQEPSTDS